MMGNCSPGIGLDNAHQFRLEADAPRRGAIVPTILLVDDNQDLLETLSAMLMAAGHRVVGAVNARDAIERFAQGRVDLVITDILMPDKDGLELITELHHAANDLPIIAISGGGGMVDSLRILDVAHKFGARHILEKPFDTRALLMAIDKALGPTPAFDGEES
jgi:DNA-binding NtrC family response regulator